MLLGSAAGAAADWAKAAEGATGDDAGGGEDHRVGTPVDGLPTGSKRPRTEGDGGAENGSMDIDKDGESDTSKKAKH